ncbi:hypothetical protein ES708_16322 [subsurface metagenome]
MKIGRCKAAAISEITIDQNIDMAGFSLTDMGSLVMAANTGIQMLALLAVDGDWCGHTVLGIAGENLAAGDIVYLENADGRLWKADADAGLMPVKGMATATILAGATGVFLLDGFLREDDWTWAVGACLYAHTDPGAMVAIAPANSGDEIQRVAIAVTADIVNFRPSKDVMEVA